MTVGLEGAGVVIAAGANAQALLGKKVAALSLGAGLYGQYRVFEAAECTVLPDSLSTVEGAALFVNPLTALAFVEAARIEGHKAIMHSAAASNLGRMLVRICVEDEIPLVNIVRREEHVALLKGIGATHVVNSSAPGFEDDLLAACIDTGATLGFDAIGGGRMAHHMLATMEKAAVARMPAYSSYGSSEFKKVYSYGLLDENYAEMHHRQYGGRWAFAGFTMPAILEAAGIERVMAMRQRILDGAKTTFASSYARHISLAEALQRDVMIAYAREATGEKYLITPNA